MKEQFEIIALATAFIIPFMWSFTYFLSGEYLKTPKTYLFWLLILASFTYMMTFFKFGNYLDIYGELFPFQAFSVLCLFPLFYLYVKSLTSERKVFFSEVWPHFIFPLIILTTYLIYQKALINPESETKFIMMMLDKEVFDEPYFKSAKLVYNIGKVIMVVGSLTYSIMIVFRLKSYYSKLKDLFSQNENNELYWLKTLLLVFCIMLVFFVLIHIIQNNQVENNITLVTISYFMFSLFFWYLGLNGFRQMPVYKNLENSESKEFDEYVKISREDLIEYIENQKPYKNPEITVFDFCYHFHTNRTYLSEAIRRNFNLNFRGLINYYRVNEAKVLIKNAVESNQYPEMEELASKSGFSSYSTFYRVFKSETGITPSEYQINLIESQKLN